jgi:hypothetical protein
MPEADKEGKGSAATILDENENSSNLEEKKEVNEIKNDIEELKKEEERKKKQDYLRQKMREMKEKEQKLSKINSINIHSNWLLLLRDSKLRELKDNIEILSQNYERQIDRRDNQIQILYRDINNAEEQFRLALRNHHQHIDELLDLQDKKIENIQQEFNNDLYLLKKEYEFEKEEIENNHENEMKKWKLITNQMNRKQDSVNEKMEENFVQTREKVKNNYSELLIQMIGTMNETIEDYKKITKQENNNYQ